MDADIERRVGAVRDGAVVAQRVCAKVPSAAMAEPAATGSVARCCMREYVRGAPLPTLRVNAIRFDRNSL
jgi:hypothetical protein